MLSFNFIRCPALPLDKNPLIGALGLGFSFGAMIGGYSLMRGWDLVHLGSIGIFLGILSIVYTIYLIFLGFGFYYVATSCLLWAVWWWSITAFTWGKLKPTMMGGLTIGKAFVTFFVIAIAMLTGIPLP